MHGLFDGDALTKLLPGLDVIKPRTFARLGALHLLERDLGGRELVQDSGLMIDNFFMVAEGAMNLSGDEMQGVEIADGGKGKDIQEDVGGKLQQHDCGWFTSSYALFDPEHVPTNCVR